MSKSQMHVVSHTHFDREWRRHYEQYRMQLVELIDHLLLIMAEDPEYTYFTLDGQVSLLEDYLAIRPEREPELRKLAEAGRLILGPWYTLPDENLIWGESIVRNLLYGHRISASFGNTMKVGYGISSFGHISQIPQIFLNFEIDNFLFSRGISEWQTRSEFFWEGPDGSQVLGLHLPDNYTKSNWFYVVYREGIGGVSPTMWRYKWGDPLGLPFHACNVESIDNNYRMLDPVLQYNSEDLHKRVLQLKKECEDVATCPVLLAMDGVDHIEPDPMVPRIIKEVNEREGYELLKHSTMEKYIEALKKELGELEVITGEMRRTSREGVHNLLFSYGMSARMYLKQANQKAQTEVVRWAEPVCAIVNLLGYEYPKSQLDRVWKYLMENHAHDCISGCSIDSVHDQNMHRYDMAKLIASELTERAFWKFIPEIDYSDLEGNDMAVTVFNPLPFPREEVISIAVDIPEDLNCQTLCIRDIEGNELPYQVMDIDKALAEMLQAMNCQVSTMMDRYYISVPVKMPALGYTSLVVRPEGKQLRPRRNPGSLSPEMNLMRNDFLEVLIQSDGSLSVIDLETAMAYEDLNYFVDRGEAGDAWQTIPPVQDEVFSTLDKAAEISRVADGPLACTYRVRHVMSLPKDIYPLKPKCVTEEGTPPTKRRHPDRVDVEINSYITLTSSARRVDIKTVINNTAKSHRLRVCFPSCLPDAEFASAEVPFDVYDRPIEMEDTSDWREPAYSSHPQLGFVSLTDGEEGFTVINEGLTEYEVKDDNSRTVELTLIRAVGRSTGEDWDPDGPQCLGKQEYRYSIYPHRGGWETAKVFEQMLAHNTPVKATQSCRYDKGSFPREYSFIEISDSDIVLDCFKRAEDKDTLILRMHNPTGEPIRTKIKSEALNINAARTVNFLEEPKEELEVAGEKVVEIEIAAKQIVTIELEAELRIKSALIDRKWNWFTLNEK